MSTSMAAVCKQLETSADNTDSEMLTLQLEDRLQQAQQENTAVVKDVADMKVAMMRLQTQRLKSGSKASLEVDMALAKVGRRAHQHLLRFADGKSGVRGRSEGHDGRLRRCSHLCWMC